MEQAPSTKSRLSPEYATPGIHITAEGKSVGQFILEGYGDIKNDDAYFILPHTRAYGVLDGVGGRTVPQLAADLARDILAKSLSTLKPNISEDEAVNRLDDILMFTNGHIRRLRLVVRGATSTTGSIAFVITDNGQEKLVTATVGDSRIYRKRAGKLELLSEDDRLLVKRSELDENNSQLNEQIKISQIAYKKTLSNWIGKKNPQIRITVHSFLPGDQVLICTDGLSDNSTDAEILEGIDKGCEQLVEDAYRRSKEEENPERKSDDITAILLKQTNGEVRQEKTKIIVNTRPRKFRTKIFIKAKNSDGSLDNKWQVDHLDLQKNQVVLVKRKGKETIEKDVSAQEFDELNPVPKVTWISEAVTEKELYAILGRIVAIRSQSGTVHPSKELIALAKEVFAGKAPSSILTRSGSLRQTVEAIIEVSVQKK